MMSVEELEIDMAEKDALIVPKSKKISNVIEIINSHIGVATLASAALVACLSGLFKAFMYVFERGKLDYWGISSLYINTGSENRFYDFFLYIAIVAIVLAVNLIPYSIITAKRAWWKKTIYFLVVMFTVSIIFIIYISLATMIDNQSISRIEIFRVALTNASIWISAVVCAFLILLIGTVAGALNIYFRKLDSKKQVPVQSQRYHTSNNMPKLVVIAIVVIICIAAYAVTFYWMGFSSARALREYRIIDGNQVILCEGDKTFLVAACQISETEDKPILLVDKNIQTEIEKIDTMTQSMEFDRIFFESLTP